MKYLPKLGNILFGNFQGKTSLLFYLNVTQCCYFHCFSPTLHQRHTKKKIGETMKYKTFKYWGWKERSYQKVLPGHRLLTGYRIIKTKESVFKISLHKQ